MRPDGQTWTYALPGTRESGKAAPGAIEVASGSGRRRRHVRCGRPPAARGAAIESAAMQRKSLITAVILVTLSIAPLRAQTRAPQPANGWAGYPPELAPLVAFARTESDLRVAVDRYLLDKAAIERRYEVPYSPVRHTRLRDVLPRLAARLEEADFDALNAEGKIDFVLLRNRIAYDVAMLGWPIAVGADGAAAAVLRQASRAAGRSASIASAPNRARRPRRYAPLARSSGLR